MITQSQLKELLSYNSETGVLTWNRRDIKWFSHCKYPERACKSWNTKYCEKIAGNVHDKKGNTGYTELSIWVCGSKKPYAAHRLIWIYMSGKEPYGEIDHIDGNGLNNSWDNLRDVSKVENAQNSTISLRNKSGFTGVSWSTERKKWQVSIRANGTNISGGRFDNLNDAIKKRIELNIEYGFHKNHGREKIT